MGLLEGEGGGRYLINMLAVVLWGFGGVWCMACDVF